MSSFVGTAVVGVDGSTASLAAHGWAEAVAGEVRDVQVDRGGVAEEILRFAERSEADLIAVGMHEQRRQVLRSLGPVLRTLLERTPVPLAVAGPDQASSPTDPVVVGIGHGPATGAAVHWAAMLAIERGTPLELVRAVPQRPVFRADGLLDLMSFYIDPSMAVDWAAADLAAFADEVDRMTGSEVPVGWSTPPGAHGPVLVAAASRAQLLVIGLHDRPGHDDHDVPGWCRHVLLHAPCPVVFVPA